MGRRAKKTEPCPEACRAICCRYVTTKINAPRNKMDFDEIHWFLCHENIEVFIEARKWYVLFDTPCRNLDERYRCRDYPARPHVCRQHAEEECEYWGEEDRKVRLRTPDDLKRYMKKRGLRLRMAWDEPEGEAGKRVPARSSFRSARKPQARQS